MHLPTHPAPRLSQVLPLIFSVVLIRYYSSMAGLSPARGLAYTPAVRTQPDHASSYHCLHAPPPSHHTSAASHHSPSPPPPGTPPLDAPPADASSPDAQVPGMLPLVCCRSRAAARRVATRRPRRATRRAPLRAATATLSNLLARYLLAGLRRIHLGAVAVLDERLLWRLSKRSGHAIDIHAVAT